MTLLAASIGADYALLSQDTAYAIANDGQVAAMDQSLRKPVFRAAYGAAPIICGHVDKVLINSDSRMAIGTIGVSEVAWAFANKALPLANIDELASRGAEIWRQLSPRRRAKPLIVVAIGWSEKRGDVRRVMFESTEGMKLKGIVHPHICHPPVFDDDPAATEIKSLYRRELSLEGTRRLHWLLGRSAARASLGGSYGEVGVIGGRLQSVLITATEANIHDAGSLDEGSDDDMPELVEFQQTAMRMVKQRLWNVPAAVFRQRWASGWGRSEAAA